MRVKICGITNREDALLCQNNGADALGFVFYKKSKRYISPESVLEISRHLSPFMLKVGVFVDETPAHINRISRQAGLHLVQLHGDEELDMIKHIHVPVIKSFRVSPGFDFKQLESFRGCKILLDSWSGSDYGGTGNPFDWTMIPSTLRSQIILAGGISLSNIEKIYTTIKPLAVDLSSALELSPGKKDPAKVAAFLEETRRLNHHTKTHSAK